MIEAKRQIEGRIAITNGLRIEKHKAVQPTQYVLRADVALHQGDARFGYGLGNGTDRGGNVRVPFGRVEQVWLQTQRKELRLVGELSRDLCIGCCRGVNSRKSRASSRGKFRVCMSCREL